MEKERIDKLLTDKGLTLEYQEQSVRRLLYYLFIAIDTYREMTVAEKNKTGYWYRLFKDTFPLKGFLKEKKRKRDKEKSPLHPSYKKESGVKEKEAEVSPLPCACAQGDSKSLKERKEDFRKECDSFKGKYPDAVVDRFFRTWAQANRKSGLMRFELQDGFDVDVRLESWAGNKYSVGDEEAALKKQRRLVPKKEQPVNTSKQQEIAREREAANRKREEEQAEAKRGAVTMEEALGRNPTGALGKLMKKNNKNQ